MRIKERVASAVCRCVTASDMCISMYIQKCRHCSVSLCYSILYVCLYVYTKVSPLQCVAMLQKPTPGGGVPGAAGRTAPPLVEAAHAAGSDSVTRRPPGTARSSVR